MSKVRVKRVLRKEFDLLHSILQAETSFIDVAHVCSVSQNKQIVIQKSGKGNSIVIVDRHVY